MLGGNRKEFGKDLSERLRLLSLPNSHLVEAVLKEHYHVFNEDCRDRLKRLLQLIVSVNDGKNKRNMQEMEEIEKVYVRSLKDRIELMNSEMFEQDQVQSSSMDCNLSSSGPEMSCTLSPQIDNSSDTIPLTKELNELSQLNRCFNQQQLQQQQEQNQECYRFEMKNDRYPGPESGDYRKNNCSGERGKEMQVIYKSKEKVEKIIGALERGDCKIPDVHRTNVPISKIGVATKTALEGKHKKGKLETLKAPLEPSMMETVETVEDPSNVPTLAVKAYVTLILDVQSNFNLYDQFMRSLIRPAEEYKHTYLDSSYRCWTDYLSYVKTTLDYLHPYIINLLRMCRKFKRGNPMLQELETKLPKVLINSLKNMKRWREALQETIDCCHSLFAKRDDKLGMAKNVHQLYMRYHKKMNGLHHRTSGKNGKNAALKYYGDRGEGKL